MVSTLDSDEDAAGLGGALTTCTNLCFLQRATKYALGRPAHKDRASLRAKQQKERAANFVREWVPPFLGGRVRGLCEPFSLHQVTL